jgi:hypothetical protein
MGAGIGVTLSRGGYLAVAASLVIFFVLLLWNRDFRLPAIGLLVLLISTSTFFGVRSWQAEKTLFPNAAIQHAAALLEAGGRDVEGEFLVWRWTATLRLASAQVAVLAITRPADLRAQ